jgi:predicted DsbA family dithiol-disulfide isomerase
MSEEKLKIIVYSDYICPFCYIGYHRMEKLKEQLEFELEWRPFELHPEIPKKGAYLNQIPFPKQYLEMVFINVKRLAEEDGISVNFSEKLPNSQLALYIAEFARKKGKFDEFHKLVFESYWREGKDIGELSLLLDLAESVGLNRDDIKEYLRSDEPSSELKKYLLEVRNYEINGVPAFIIGKRIIFGAQPYEVFINAIEKALVQV